MNKNEVNEIITKYIESWAFAPVVEKYQALYNEKLAELDEILFKQKYKKREAKFWYDYIQLFNYEFDKGVINTIKTLPNNNAKKELIKILETQLKKDKNDIIFKFKDEFQMSLTMERFTEIDMKKLELTSLRDVINDIKAQVTCYKTTDLPD